MVRAARAGRAVAHTASLAAAIFLSTCGLRGVAARCHDGVADRGGEGAVCCHKDCGVCGGPACELRPGGASRCCGGSIPTPCINDDGPPPCVYGEGPDELPALARALAQQAAEAARGESQPADAVSAGRVQRVLQRSLDKTVVWASTHPAAGMCTAGVRDQDGRGAVCCARGCGRCGGEGCGARPGGPAACCAGDIRAKCRNSMGPPPCVYEEGWDSYPDGWRGPPPRARALQRPAGPPPLCTAGVQDKSGRACCDSACTQCGGPGCEHRPGGPKKCCGGSIPARCVSFTGPPPCIYSEDWFEERDAAEL